MNTVAIYEIEDDSLETYVNHILANCITVLPGQQKFDALFEREVSVSHKFIKVENFRNHILEEIARAEKFQYRINITNFEISGFYELEMFRKQATITIVLSDDDQDIVEINTVHDFSSNPNWEFNKLFEEGFDLVERYNLKREIENKIREIPVNSDDSESSFKL